MSVMADYLVELYGGTTGPEAVHLDQSCMAAMPVPKRHTCWSAAVHYPFIKTPLLLAQNRFDQNQCGSILGADWWPLPEHDHNESVAKYVRYFGRQTMAGIAHKVMYGPKNSTDGLFMPSCYAHGDNFCLRPGSTVVRGLRYGSVLADWFHGHRQLPHLLFDDCNARLGTDDPCNPMCTCALP